MPASGIPAHCHSAVAWTRDMSREGPGGRHSMVGEMEKARRQHAEGGSGAGGGQDK